MAYNVTFLILIFVFTETRKKAIQLSMGATTLFALLNLTNILVSQLTKVNRYYLILK